MGSDQQAAMRSTAIAILLVSLAAVWAVTEVQELGNDDTTAGVATSLDADDSAEYDDIGETTGVGSRRAAFLSTSGSFTLSSGTGSTDGNGEEDELGEGLGVGSRRAAFLSTSGSFTLSSGTGSTDGNGEEDEYEF